MAATATGTHPFVQGVHGVRYQVRDVARSVEFYTTHLGFTLQHQQLPAFAASRSAMQTSCSAAHKPQGPGQCPMARRRSPAAGTVSCCGSTISRGSSRP